MILQHGEARGIRFTDVKKKKALSSSSVTCNKRHVLTTSRQEINIAHMDLDTVLIQSLSFEVSFV